MMFLDRSNSDVVYYSIRLCVGVYLLYLTTSAVYCLFFHPLSKFPGPRHWAISRIPWAWHVFKGDLWAVQAEFHAKHGPIVRIAPDEITTISPTAWKDIYVSKPLLPKDPFSQTPPLNGAHSLFTAAGSAHKRIRATLANAFSSQALRDQSPIIEEYSSKLISRLQRESDKSTDGVVDIQKYFGYANLDIVSDLSFGESYHGLDGDNEHSWIQGFFFHAKFGTIRNCLSRFAPLDIVLGLIMLSVTRKSRVKNWRTITTRIENRLSRGDMTGVRSDFITPVIGRIDEGGKNGITKNELITNGLGFVIADCQLATVAMSASTYLLLRDPEILKHLVGELRSRFEKQDQITVQSTIGLVYLEAVINEALRIHHPTPISLPRLTPAEGHTVDGTFIPGNTVIGINLQNIQNSPTLWHKPRGFHPERFLPPTHALYDPAFERDVKAAFVPFSTGPRNCLGGRVFLAQARIILAKVFWNFDLKMVGNQKNWLDQDAYLVFEPKPLPVTIHQRLQ